jgi:hypothetical protein
MDTAEDLANNDELVAYLAKHRKSEVNASLSDAQIIIRNRNNLRYLLTAYLFLSYPAVAIYSDSRLGTTLPMLSFVGALYLLSRIWRLDGLLKYCITRDARTSPTG